VTVVHIVGAVFFVALWLIGFWNISRFWRAYASWKRGGRGPGSVLYLDVLPVRLAEMRSLFLASATQDQREAREALVRMLACVTGAMAVGFLQFFV
jgi:hypothetical protein